VRRLKGVAGRVGQRDDPNPACPTSAANRAGETWASRHTLPLALAASTLTSPATITAR